MSQSRAALRGGGGVGGVGNDDTERLGYLPPLSSPSPWFLLLAGVCRGTWAGSSPPMCTSTISVPSVVVV